MIELAKLIHDHDSSDPLRLGPGIYGGDVDIREPITIEGSPNGPTLWDGGFEHTFRVEAQHVGLFDLWACNGRDHAFGAARSRNLVLSRFLAWQDVPPEADRERMANNHVLHIDRSESVTLLSVGAFGWGRKAIQFHYSRYVYANKLYARWDGRHPHEDQNRGAFFPAYGSGNVTVDTAYLTHGGSPDPRKTPDGYDPGCNLLGADHPDDWFQAVNLNNIHCVVDPDARLSCSRPIRLTTSPNVRLEAKVSSGEHSGECRFDTTEPRAASTATLRTTGGVSTSAGWTVFEESGLSWTPRPRDVLGEEFADKLLAASQWSDWTEIR